MDTKIQNNVSDECKNYVQSVSLDDIALKYPTDKSSKGHGYTAYYQDVLEKRRLNIKSLLELGVGIWDPKDNTKWGPSLRMWRDWLPNAQIVGLDRTPAPNPNFGPRISFVNSDQTSIKGLNLALAMLNNSVDIIIDDASHINRLTIATFEYLFPRLNKGGIYFIEDTMCSNSSNIFPGNNYHELEDFVIMLMRSQFFNYRVLNDSNYGDFRKNNPDAVMNVYERWVEKIELVRGIIAIYKRNE